jgi:hypothetical protein
MKKAKGAKRIQLAKETGLRLCRRLEEIDGLAISNDHKAMMIEQLADEFLTLITEYPDVYPEPPVSPEVLRAHAQALKDASDKARQAEADYQVAHAEAEEARRVFDKTINEIASPRREPEKPS